MTAATARLILRLNPTDQARIARAADLQGRDPAGAGTPYRAWVNRQELFFHRC
jgi:hypothetical protein